MGNKNKHNEEPGTALAVNAEDGIATRFPIMAMEKEGLKSLIESNLGTSTLKAHQLPQLKIPGAGGQMWEVPSIEGAKNVSEIEAIVLYWRDTRVRFKYKYGEAPASEGKQRPLCKSEDSIRGEGDPGIVCAKCPHSQWHGDESPTCANKRLLFILPAGEMLPLALFLPQQSIKPCFQYFTGLLSKGLRHDQVLTTFGLSQEKNPNNVKYSVCRPRLLAKLTPEQQVPVQQYREAMLPVFAGFSVEKDEAEEGVNEVS